MDHPSPDSEKLRRAPHPLAAALIGILEPGASVADAGAGRGRHTAALRAAGLQVTAIPDDRVSEFGGTACYDAVLSTHALLHGTPQSIGALVERIARALKPDALFYATFASRRDSRFGVGTRIDESTYAPEDGDEAGVPHAYFDGASLRQILDRSFVIESMTEERVDDIVGRWAHERPPSGSVHWFVRARKRAG